MKWNDLIFSNFLQDINIVFFFFSYFSAYMSLKGIHKLCKCRAHNVHSRHFSLEIYFSMDYEFQYCF